MEHLNSSFSQDELADALDVSKSGFHDHRRKASRPRRQQDAQLRPILRECFEQSRRNYGSPRLRDDLRDRGIRCGKNRVARLMREEGIRPKQKRRFRPVTTDSRHAQPIAENWLAKVPVPDRPNQVWQSDITYIETQEGWLYLAFTLDACSRKVVAHHCGEDLSASLVTTTFTRALQRQSTPAGLIHHSDRGCQYASSAFRLQLALHHVTPSMSRSGNPYDNALAESFVATLKTECFAGYIPQTKRAAQLMIFDYIEAFYNTRRKHSALNYRSPLQFETTQFPQNQYS
jgi:transposase InsO family protein